MIPEDSLSKLKKSLPEAFNDNGDINFKRLMVCRLHMRLCIAKVNVCSENGRKQNSRGGEHARQ